MNINFKKDGKLHRGHRERMRNKLVNHGDKIFETYELFEMLLYYTIRYRDTNDIAKRLFQKYKTADKILSSKPEELSEIEGIGSKCAEFISLVGKAEQMLDIKGYSASPTLLDCCDAAGEYLLGLYKHEVKYEIKLLLLNNNMTLLKCITMYNAEFNSAQVKPEDFVNKSLHNHAACAIIAYNHPYGPDVQLFGESATREAVTRALRDSGVYVPEVYMIVGNKYFPLESSNRYKTFMQSPLMSCFYKKNGWNMPLFCSAPDSDPKSFAALFAEEAPLEYLKDLLSYVADLPTAGEYASRLIEKYGTLRNILSEPASRITELTGMSDSHAMLLKLVAYITSRRAAEQLAPKRIYSEQELSRYISALFIGADVEQIYALLLDGRKALISCEFMGSGSVNSSGFVPRVLLDLSVKVNARFLILAHNHPNGTPKPSDDDLLITSAISESLLNIGVTLLGHYIVAGNECKPIQLEPSLQPLA